MNLQNIFFLPAAAGLITDQLLKYKTEKMPAGFFPHPLMGGRLIWERHHNFGFAMNRADRHPKAVTAAVLAIFTALGAVLMPEFLGSEGDPGDPGAALGFALILSGGFSNLLDRLTHGYVVDYIRFPVKKIRHVIMNIGDLCLFAGSLLVVIAELCSFRSAR